MRRPAELRAWKSVLAVGTLLAAGFALADWAVGRWQEGLVQGKKDYRARLDRLAFRAVRTGIDEISHQPDGRYRSRFIVQNASDEALFVMMPTVEAAIQVGPQWVGIPATENSRDSSEGNVVRLIGERMTDRYLSIEATDYTESIPGYIHLKLTLEMIVSPEQNPQEEVGERKEDLVVYLKDHRLAHDRMRHARPSFAEKPDFIPLRAWTLVPRTASVSR